MVARPRHVLITGGSRGIGLAIAQLFAKKGYRCTLISRSEDVLKAAVATLHPLPDIQIPKPRPTIKPDPEAHLASDPTLSFLSEDYATTPSSSHTVQSDQPTPYTYTHSYVSGDITSHLNFWDGRFSPSFPKPPHPGRDPNHPSRIDVLVNCAGITQQNLFLKADIHDMNTIVDTNLTSLMVGTKLLLRWGYLRVPGPKLPGRREVGESRREESPREEGSTRSEERAEEASEEEQDQPQALTFTPSIINLSSLLALRSGFGAVSYAASKAGILGFTRALASEYSTHRVRVNAIVPGYVDTDMTTSLYREGLEKRIPLGRFGKTEEIAQAAVFLAENQYAHNCVVNLDGGLSAM